MPDVVDDEAWVLWYRVMAKNLDGFADSPRVPVLDGGDESAVVPFDVVLRLLGMFDYG